jgi:4-amino-4-deoxy-L-arabinose transferase-like glycosyltransferase
MRERFILLLLVGLAFAGSLALAGSFPLIDPDEGRNAEVAREMLAIGDWVVPHLAGMPYLDKPPALFWAETLSFRLFGVTPLAARLPAAAAAAAILWMLGGFALASLGRRHAFTLVALLATAPLFAVLSAYVIFDMLLATCVTALWIGVARETRDDAAPGIARALGRIGMFIALALGVLVKGPVMLAWGVGGSLGAALLARSRAPLRWLAWGPGWIVFLAIAGGWFALALARHPEYAHYAFIDETFRRMTTGAFEREQPWWFVAAVLAGGALPWSLTTPWTRRIGIESRVALGFVLFAAVFFTLSRSKLVTYLLPALPALAWVAAEAWSETRRAARGSVALAVLLAALAGAGWLFGTQAALWGSRIEADLVADGMVRARGLGIAFAALAALSLVAWRARRPALALVAAALLTPSILVIGGPVGTRFARAESGAPLAEAIVRYDPGARVRYEFAYSPGTDFLLGRGGWFVTETGHEFTSNYQVYYRETLEARGRWVPSRIPGDAPPAEVIVRQVRGAGAGPPPGWVEFHRDRRFVAYHPEPDSR